MGAKPADLFARDHEWADLHRFATDPGPGIRLGLVRGRRRQGKSFLLRRLVEATGGFYFQAVEEGRSLALQGFGAALGHHLQVPGGRLDLRSWDDALDALADLPSTGHPAVVVIDELPYLLAAAPELPSVLQRAIDRSRDGGPLLRLILCGSAISVMADLLAGPKALRGRASLDLVVSTFDHRAAARYWGLDDPEVAFGVHAVLGGTPGYRDLTTAAAPRRPRDLAGWLADGPLNPSSALFREDDYLLAEERTSSDRALYRSVLASIARGSTTQTTIAADLGRPATAVHHPLRALEEAGFVRRTDDALRNRRPIFRIADPIVRFHQVVTRPDLARFEDRRTAAAWTDALPRYQRLVLGPHFEDLAREFVSRFAAPETTGGVVADVAPAVINDRAGRTQHEVDVVARGRTSTGTTTVLALGEAKHTGARRTTSDLDRLDHIRRLITPAHPEAATAKLLLFSASGFDPNLIAEARRRPDVELLDLRRIYEGA